MKLIISNLRSFIKGEPLIFTILLMCIFFSTIILCFSYGAFVNYSKEKQEMELDLNSVTAEPQNDFESGHLLTKAMLKEYLMSLSPETQELIRNFYCTIQLLPPASEEDIEGAGRKTPFFINIKNGEFCVADKTRDNWIENGTLADGRYFTDEEEKNGENVALVGMRNENGRLVPWDEVSSSLRTGEDTLELGGKEYRVVGAVKYTFFPLVPFESLDDDVVILDFSAVANKNITSRLYRELVTTADTMLHDYLIYEEIDIPEAMDRKLRNNLIILSAAIAFLSAFNFIIPYKYILSQRKQILAIFRLNGCTVCNAVFLFLSEALIFSMPVFLTAVFIYDRILIERLKGFFPYMSEAYSTVVYAGIAAVYFFMLASMLAMLLTGFAKKDVCSLIKEG